MSTWPPQDAAMAKSLNTMVFRICWLTWQGDSALVRCVTAGHRVSLRAGDLYSSHPHPLQAQREGTGGSLLWWEVRQR